MLYKKKQENFNKLLFSCFFFLFTSYDEDLVVVVLVELV